MNPRPNRDVLCFLHAYPGLLFSGEGKTRATDIHLISFVFTCGAEPPQAIPDIAVPLGLEASEQQPQSDISSMHLVQR